MMSCLTKTRRFRTSLAATALVVGLILGTTAMTSERAAISASPAVNQSAALTMATQQERLKHPVSDHQEPWSTWFFPAARVNVQPQNGVNMCTYDATLLAQEFGTSGVRQFRARLRIYNDEVNPYVSDSITGWTNSLVTGSDTGWTSTQWFDDNSRSQAAQMRYTKSYAMAGNFHRIRIRVVAVRPGFWLKNYVSDISPGACEAGGAAIHFG